MRYTLSSITITEHPGTELCVISKRGRWAGGQDTQQTGRDRRAGCGPQGYTEATRRKQHFATHSRFVFVWLFCVLTFFSFFSFATCTIW